MLRREKDILQSELRAQQEIVAKLQSQQHQTGAVVRSSKIDEATVRQKEALEKKLSSCFVDRPVCAAFVAF